MIQGKEKKKCCLYACMFMQNYVVRKEFSLRDDAMCIFCFDVHQ